MSARRRWFGGGWYESPPKQPVPAAGIAAGRFGATWWGREWIVSLERLGRAWANRLPRGRSYARAGRVVDLEVGAGSVTAGVVGTRTRPYRVEIALPPLPPDAWARALEALTEDTLTVIRLLNRELPDEVGVSLRAAGIDLFPAKGELRTGCSCPDVANPCKHVAATHYLFAAALDNDPFLLFRLRGLDRERLVDAIAGAGAVPAAPVSIAPGAAGQADLEPAAELDPAVFVGRDLAPPVLELEPRAPRVELVGVRRLGPPPRGLERLPDLLAPAIRAASRLALKLAWGDPDAPPERPVATTKGTENGPPAPSTVPRRRGRRSREMRTPAAVAAPAAPVSTPAHRPQPRERLVARLEGLLIDARRPLSRRELVTRLQAGPGEVNAALKELRGARLVTSVGRGPATRYELVRHAAPVHPRRRGRRPRRPANEPATLIVEALREAGRPLPLRELAATLGLSLAAVRPVLLALRQNGVVEMVGRRRNARYRIAG